MEFDFASLPWATIIVAIVSFLSATLVTRSTNRKMDGEGAEAISSAAVRLVSPLETRVEKLVSENEQLRNRMNALEAEARELETFRFENQHLKERINHLEIQVEILSEKNVASESLEAKLRFERERAGTLAQAVGALAGQVISLGGEPIVDFGEEYVE